MNRNDSPSSPNDKQPAQTPQQNPMDPTPPKTAPLSSPNEPTRAFPSDPSRTYSSDPSQYAHIPSQSTSNEPSKIYTTEPLDTARIAKEERRSTESQAQKEREQAAFEAKNRKTADAASTPKKGFYSYVASNREQTIVYILLILSLLLIFFGVFLLGGLMLGMVAGYYFSAEIVDCLRNLGQIAMGEHQLRYIVLTAVALGFLIAAPGIFIGAILVATFKQVMTGPRG